MNFAAVPKVSGSFQVCVLAKNFRLTSMKREMLMIAWSVSLNTSLQVRTLPGGLVSSTSLDRKLEMSATVQSVFERRAWKKLAVMLFFSRVWIIKSGSRTNQFIQNEVRKNYVE